MADNIVQSLFGLDPYQTQMQQQDALRQQAAAYANMAPQQRAAMSLYQAGGQLAGAGAEGLFGMVNPAVAKAQATEQAMMGLDMSSPQSILARANSVTDPRLRIQLQLLAQQRQAQQQKAALDASTTALHNAQAYKAFQPEDKRTNEQKNAEALAAASGLTKGTPEWDAAIKDTMEALVKNPNLQVTTVGADKPGWKQVVVVDKSDGSMKKIGPPMSDAAATRILLGGIGGAIKGMYNLSPEQNDALVKAMNEGRVNPERVNSRSAIILANLFLNDPTLNMVGGAADSKGRIAAQTKVQTDIAKLRPFIRMVDMNGDVLVGLANKVSNLDSSLLNKPINWLLQKGTANPALAEYMVQVKIFKDEAARVVSNPNLVGVLSDTARREMEAVVNGDMPLSSLIAVVRRLQADSHNRLSALDEELQHLRGTGVRGDIAPTAATPTTQGAAKTVVRTGMQGNRKVIQYSDGSIEYGN